MLHDLLSKYLIAVDSVIRTLENAYIERYEQEILTWDRINLRLRVRFTCGWLLEINEAVIVEAESMIHLGYRYHLQDQHHTLLFRYDNTPHFAGIVSFPHHKHMHDQVVAADRPPLLAVIEEVRQLLEPLNP